MAAASLLLGTAAAAADAPHVVLSPAQGPPGTSVTAHGTAFCVSCGPVELDFVARPVKQGIAVASDGSFQATFVVPGGAQAGTNAVNAYQQGKLVTQTSFAVTPSAPAPGATATPTVAAPPANSPIPGPGASATPGGQPPAPQETPSASATPAAPSPAPSSGQGGPSAPAAGTGTPTGIALSALLALLVVTLGAVLLYRRLRSAAAS